MARNLHFAEFAARSELGLHRDGNEDSGLLATNLLAVADGMGGYAGGEVASRTVIATLAKIHPTLFSDLDGDSRDDIYRSSIFDMDAALREIATAKPELDGMGTTLTSIALFEDHVHLLHIGDSRAYRIRGGKIARLSHDHTVVQELLDQGRITADEVSDHPQRSFLTQALMGKENLEPVLQAFPAEVGDTYLLCSDGLTAVVDEGKIAAAMKLPLADAVNSLIDLTYENGAPDNVTVVAARVVEDATAMKVTMVGAAS